MSEKILNSRMVQKHDIEANWLKATNFTPLQGELIVYDVDENYNYERIKMGDGVTNVNELPFISPQVDLTLTVEGAAADAKAVGDLWNNLPTDADVWETLINIGLYERLADESGNVLTDEANAILLI